MATNEFSDTIGITRKSRYEHESGTGGGVLFSGIFIVIILLLLIIIVALYLFITSGVNVANIAFLCITVVSSLGGVFASIQLLRQRAFVIQIQERDEELKEDSDKFLQDYKRRILQDPEITKIKVLGMTVPVDVSDTYIKLKGRPCNTMKNRQQVEQSEQESNARGISKKHSSTKSILDETFDLNPIKFIAHHPYCIVMGDPGSGKTTLLKHLCSLTPDQWAGESGSNKKDRRLPTLPIYIRLHSFASFLRNTTFQQGVKDIYPQGGPLFDFIYNKKWREEYGFAEEASYYLPMFMHGGEALLLLDGLDEVALGPEPKESYQRVIEAIQTLASYYPDLPIVITVRKATYFQQEKFKLRERFIDELEILPFGLDDIRTFVTNWFRDQPQAMPDQEKFDSRELITGIEQIPRVRELVSNPLFLLVIVFTYYHYKFDQHSSDEQKFDLTRHQADLYQRCFDSFAIWDDSRGIRRPISRVVKNNLELLLEHVAYHFQWERQEWFTEADMRKQIGIFLQENGIERESGSVLHEIATSNGLLRQNETGNYQFLHQRFQEYFAARYLARYEKEQDIQDIFDRIERYDPWWNEVVIVYAAYASQNSLQVLLEKLSDRNQNGDDFFLTPLVLAGHCLAARSNSGETNGKASDWQKHEPGSSIIARLFTALQETGYSLTRDRVAKALVDIGGDGVQKLGGFFTNMSQADETQSSICLSIARALNVAHNMELPDVTFHLLKSKYSLLPPHISKSIAQALGELAMQAPEMINLLSHGSQDDSLRINMAYALAFTREPVVAYDLFSLLGSGQIQEESILWQIVDTLGKLGEASQAPDLCRMLSNIQIPIDVRRHLAEMIGKLDNLDVVPTLVSLLKDQELDNEVRCAIAGALGDMHVKSSIPGLQECYEDVKIPQIVRDFIASTLCRLKDYDVVLRLQKLLPQSTSRYFEGIQDKDARVTATHLGEEVAAALGTVEGIAGVQPFLHRNLMNNEIDLRVRSAIARALGRRGAEKDALLQILNDSGEDWELRAECALALGDLQDPAIISDLLVVLQDQKAPARARQRVAEAIEFLAAQDTDSERLKQCADCLVDLLNDEKPRTPSDLADSLHFALWEVSRRLPMFRIIQADSSSQIIVEPVRK